MVRLLFTLLLLFFCISCAAPQEPQPPASPSLPEATIPDSSARHYAAGQRIYVPAYSHIYYQNNRRVINLATTLSIRNTDASRPLTIEDVRYYDSEGKLVRHYVEHPVRLGPMASQAYVVEVDDTSGGSGASFIVEWRAEEAVTQPVVEAVMISTASTQGISFVTTGRVLEDRGADHAE